jgi:S1-C subfamily serine protease
MPPPATVVSTLSSHSVRLSYPSSTTDSETQPKTAAGTLIGKGRIVSKLSLAGSATSATVSVDQPGDDVRRQQATLIAADRSLDLALWQTETIIGPLERPAPASDAGPGQIVYAAGKEPRLGIISRIEHTEPQVTPQLGLRLDQLPDDRLIVRRVSPSSASSDAGILEQDLLLSLGDRVVSQLADIRPVLVNYQPGDWISFRCQREDTQPVLSFGQLRHDPASLLLRSEFLDGNSGLLSQRRTGFAAVIQHDIAILAADCGGPLISPSGQLVAINIARRGRESTLAIPIATVIRFAESHLSR